MAYVYFIRAGIYTKIGVAKNVSRRLEQLQTGNPLELRLTAAVKLPSIKSAYHFEGLLHSELMDRHKHGEWFYIKSARIKDIISKYSESEKFEPVDPISIHRKRDTEKIKSMRYKLKAAQSELSRLREENFKLKKQIN